MSERLILTTRALCLSAALFIATPALSAEWESLPPLPEPSGGSLNGISGKKIVTVGGTNWEGGTKNWLRAIREFDPAARTWTKVKDLDRPVAYGVVFQTKDAKGAPLFSFIGGSDGTQPLKFFAGVDGAKTAFKPISQLPDALVLCAGGQLGERDIIVGGTNDAANIAGSQRTVHSVEWRKGGWTVTQMANYPGEPFCVAASAVCGAELFVFGGANWDEKTKGEKNAGVVNSDAAHAFDALKNEWRKLKPLPFAARGMTAVAIDQEHIYLAGGYRSDPEGFTAEALIYDVRADTYRPAKPLPYAASVGLVVLDGFVYCIGGEDKMKHRTNAFFRIKADALK